MPVGNERLLLHVGVHYGGVACALGEEFGLQFCSDCGVVVEGGAVADDEQGGFFLGNVRSSFSGAMKEDVGHMRMASHWLAVVAAYAVDDCPRPLEAQFAGNNGLSKIAFADEDRDEVSLWRIYQVFHIAKGGFFLPKAAVNFTEDASAADFLGMVVCGLAAVGVFC